MMQHLAVRELIHLTSQDGTGKRISLQVHVPAGIDDGQSIRLKRQRKVCRALAAEKQEICS